MAQVGRPRIIESPDEFLNRANAYFAQCEKDDEPVTITGMSLAIGLCGRKALDDYEARPEFCDAVKTCRSYVEAAYERRMQGSSPAGAIFALKNMGWRDQQDVNHGGEIGIRRIERVIVGGES